MGYSSPKFGDTIMRFYGAANYQLGLFQDQIVFLDNSLTLQTY